MDIIFGKKIKEAIEQVQAEKIAVAFVGGEWDHYVKFDKLKEIIVAPVVGSNPNAISKLADKLGWENIHFLDSLHSKIYLGRNAAAFGSFNLSENGLSGTKQENAGIFVQDQDKLATLRKLYKSYKLNALKYYPTKASKQARLSKLFDETNKAYAAGLLKKSIFIESLADYVVPAKPEFYFGFFQQYGLTYNIPAFEATVPEIVHNNHAGLEEMMKDTLAFLEGDKVKENRWLLYWKCNENGAMDSRFLARWLYIHSVIPDAVKTKSKTVRYTKLAVQWKHVRDLPPIPFKVGIKENNALKKVLDSGQFAEFLPNNETDIWTVNGTFRRSNALLEAWKAQLV